MSPQTSCPEKLVAGCAGEVPLRMTDGGPQRLSHTSKQEGRELQSGGQFLTILPLAATHHLPVLSTAHTATSSPVSARPHAPQLSSQHVYR